jgi:hypothetical protein
VGALAALVLGAATPLHAQTASALPPGEGRELVATACTQCHTLSVITAGRDGPVGWKKHVYNMVLRGTQLTPREADIALDISSPISARPRRLQPPARCRAARAKSWSRRVAPYATTWSGSPW